MRIIIALFVFGVTAIASADSKITCGDEAEKFVKGIELVYDQTYGPYQGDYSEYQLTTYLQQQSPDLVILKVTSDHMNEDNEGWTQNYQLTYDVVGNNCYLKTYTYLGVTVEEDSSVVDGAKPVSCVDDATAQKALEQYLKPQINTVPSDDFFWLDPDDQNSVLTEKMAKDAVDNLIWQENGTEVYRTSWVFEGECAPSATCWVGYTVSCEGAVYTWTEGED